MGWARSGVKGPFTWGSSYEQTAITINNKKMISRLSDVYVYNNKMISRLSDHIRILTEACLSIFQPIIITLTNLKLKVKIGKLLKLC